MKEYRNFIPIATAKQITTGMRLTDICPGVMFVVSHRAIFFGKFITFADMTLSLYLETVAVLRTHDNRNIQLINVMNSGSLLLHARKKFVGA